MRTSVAIFYLFITVEILLIHRSPHPIRHPLITRMVRRFDDLLEMHTSECRLSAMHVVSQRHCSKATCVKLMRVLMLIRVGRGTCLWWLGWQLLQAVLPIHCCPHFHCLPLLWSDLLH